MSFVALEFGVWIDQWIFVVESGDVTDIQHAILHAVDPATTVSRGVGWKTERMCNPARWVTIVRQLPQLFYADAVDLWFTSFIES